MINRLKTDKENTIYPSSLINQSNHSMLHTRHRLVFIFLLFSIQYIFIIQTCKVKQIATPEEIVSKAFAIVRVRPMKYSRTNDNSTFSMIKFKVKEIIKGPKSIPTYIELKGFLNHTNDFNDHSVPYTRVRPNGRLGSCFAYTYKFKAEFLLFLDENYSLSRQALAPVNEQLHSPSTTDPWLKWVKKQMKNYLFSVLH